MVRHLKFERTSNSTAHPRIPKLKGKTRRELSSHASLSVPVDPVLSTSSVCIRHNGHEISCILFVANSASSPSLLRARGQSD
jgi:hypothetical protein